MRRFKAFIRIYGMQMTKIGCMFPNGKVAVQSENSHELTVFSNLDEMKLEVTRTDATGLCRVTFIDDVQT